MAESMAISGKQEEKEEEEEGEESVEYVSEEEEEEILRSTRRRKEASDDEDGEEREKVEKFDPRVSDYESDGQGGVEEEEEVEEDEEEVEEEEEAEEVEEEEEEEVEEKVNEGEGGYDGGDVGVVETVKKPGWNDWGSEGEEKGFQGKNQVEEKETEEKEKEKEKEPEPFAVPTTGAFYMHDDRFGDGARGRQRHTPGGRKLWETKDNQKWGHDKFEEMRLQESPRGKEKKNSRGRYRGRSNSRGMKHGYVGEHRFNADDEHASQNHAPKVVRGRGPRRYKSPATINNGAWATRHNQSRKSHVTTSNTSSGRISPQNRNAQSDLAAHRKQVFASSLSSASPPFYPSGSSKSGSSPINMQKRDSRVGSMNRNVPSSIEIEENISVSHSNAFFQGKAAGNPNGQDRLYNEKSISQVSTKLTNLQMQSFGSSPSSMHPKPQGRGASIKGSPNYQSASSGNQGNRAFAQAQLPVVQRRPMHNPVRPSVGTSHEQLGLRLGGESQGSSPKAPSGNSSESGETESPPRSSSSTSALDGKGKNNVQGSGRGSFLYGGHQVFGAGGMAVAHGDRNFPLFQVMQFGGQHPSGRGVHAVGMALPGYVAQPHLGFANSEMTWLPPLAGAASALGTPPYFAVDDGYSGHPSGQTSSSGVSSREMSTNKPSNMWKPPERPDEPVTDESAQRQNKPRRYSEMNFGQ